MNCAAYSFPKVTHMGCSLIHVPLPHSLIIAYIIALSYHIIHDVTAPHPLVWTYSYASINLLLV